MSPSTYFAVRPRGPSIDSDKKNAVFHAVDVCIRENDYFCYLPFLSWQVVEGLGSTRARLRQELHPAVARGLSEVTAAA